LYLNEVTSLFIGPSYLYFEKELGTMDFCSKCGAILVAKKIKASDQPTLVFVCNKCGQKIKETTENVKFRSKKIDHSPKQLVSVIDKENQLSTLPTIQITCAKCGNKKAYAWQVQTRGADESSTQFLRCTSCGYTFRECT
jgi:DNA-directed RNA polymerase subunit M